MTIHEINKQPTVATCDGSSLLIEYLVENDPIVVRLLRDADDAAEGAHACLQVGARALLAGHTALDEVLVGRSFEHLSERLDASVAQGVDRLTESAGALLDEEDGALTRVLADLREELAARLGQLFDPNSKTSALALLEEVFAETSTRAAASLQATFAVDDPDSPLGRWRTELSREVRDRTDDILKEVRELATTVAVDGARAEMFQKTTLKGAAYEDIVHLCFAEVAAHSGDMVEDVSRERGASGSLVGDLVITLDPEDFAGQRAAIVLEVKTKKMSLRKILDELDAAMTNRAASVGIAVFSSGELTPPGHSVFVPHGNSAVLVLDADAPSSQAVELAVSWARWVLQRSPGGDPSTFDLQRFGELIAKATRGLDRVTTIRKCHSTVKRQVDQAASELTDLATDVQEALSEIRELGGS